MPNDSANQETHADQADSARREVLEAARRYFDAKAPARFVPGETYIPPSGKVLDADDLEHLVDAALDLWLTAGRFSERFEEALAQRIGVRHAHMTVSGSAANLLAFSALTSPRLRTRILAGSEVLTVAASFPTTVAPIVQNRCVPVFVDVDLDTHNVDVTRLAEAVSPKTRAIMIAHTMGNPFDLAAVTRLAEEHDLHLIEDCCDAFGATFEGQNVGTFGTVGTLSFYPAHHITTGEGGAVFTRRKAISKLIESFRDWGRDCWCKPGMENTCGKRFEWKQGDLPRGYDHKYIYPHLGYNLKATDMQAAVGLSQLGKLDRFIAARRANFNTLKSAFVEQGYDEHFHVVSPTPGAEPSWFGFLLTVRDESPLKRNAVINYLTERKIGTRLLFAGNIIRQPAFAGVEYRVSGPLDMTDKVMRDTFWIGVWPGLTKAHIEYIVEVFGDMIRELAGGR